MQCDHKFMEIHYHWVNGKILYSAQIIWLECYKKSKVAGKVPTSFSIAEISLLYSILIIFILKLCMLKVEGYVTKISFDSPLVWL